MRHDWKSCPYRLAQTHSAARACVWVQSSRWDEGLMSAVPGTEAPGYFRGAPPALILQASSGYGGGRFWGPLRVVGIFGGGRGQGAADLGGWVGGVLVE